LKEEIHHIALLFDSSADDIMQWMLNLVGDVKVHQKIGEFSVDIHMPEWNLAVEYQGGQHAFQSWCGDFLRCTPSLFFDFSMNFLSLR
jgi:hypothetical protein